MKTGNMEYGVLDHDAVVNFSERYPQNKQTRDYGHTIEVHSLFKFDPVLINGDSLLLIS